MEMSMKPKKVMTMEERFEHRIRAIEANTDCALNYVRAIAKSHIAASRILEIEQELEEMLDRQEEETSVTQPDE